MKKSLAANIAAVTSAANVKQEESKVKRELTSFALQGIKPVKHGKSAVNENKHSN